MSDERIKVIPKAGLVIRDPLNPSIPLPPEGKEVQDTRYWRRRLAVGDVTLSEEG